MGLYEVASDDFCDVTGGLSSLTIIDTLVRPRRRTLAIDALFQGSHAQSLRRLTLHSFTNTSCLTLFRIYP